MSDSPSSGRKLVAAPARRNRIATVSVVNPRIGQALEIVAGGAALVSRKSAKSGTSSPCEYSGDVVQTS
jgi:hypothetical protein